MAMNHWLAAMVFSGALRNVLTKVCMQYGNGLDDPYFVSLLYTVGSAMALPLYFLLDYVDNDDRRRGGSTETNKKPTSESFDEYHVSHSQEDFDFQRKRFGFDEESLCQHSISYSPTRHDARDILKTPPFATHPMDISCMYIDTTNCQLDNDELIEEDSESDRDDAIANGCLVSFVERIPKPLAPLFSSSLRVLALCFRIQAFYYLPASLVVILTTGLELVATGVASYYHMRALTRRQWEGMAIVLLGSTIAVFSKPVFSSSSGGNYLLGLIFLLLKVLCRVPSDLMDEVFMKDCSYPPLLLLGLSSIYMTGLGLLLYCMFVVPFAGFHLHESFYHATSSRIAVALALSLTLSVCVAGVCAIVSTLVTCTLTRGIWKGLQGLVVWVAGVIIYYSAGARGSYGEPWVVPGSPILLIGCAVMTMGIVRYSSVQSDKPRPPSPDDDTSTKEVASVEESVEACVQSKKLEQTRQDDDTSANEVESDQESVEAKDEVFTSPWMEDVMTEYEV